MCWRSRAETCETRYRHKLNMLTPGLYMVGAALLLFVLAVLLGLFDKESAAYVLCGAAGLVLLVLLVLVRIELHQDRVLYELANKQEHLEEEPRKR